MKIISITPAKKNSIRVKDKNIQKIGGVPLIENKVMQLLSSKIINGVVVGTNSAEVKKILKNYAIKILNRDNKFCGTLDENDTHTANDMIFDLVSRVNCDVIVWAHCTNPLITSDIYDEAIEVFFKKIDQGYDSLASVTKIQEHLFDKNFMPVNFNAWDQRHPLAPELDPYYKFNGAIFIQYQRNMKKYSNFIGRKPYLFQTNELLSIDINTSEDFDYARHIHSLSTK